MAGTSNLSFPLFAGFRQSRSVRAIWPAIVADPPVRHASRPKYICRTRGSDGVTSLGARHRPPSLDYSTVWAAQTEAAKFSLRMRSVAKISATIMSIGVVLGGYAVMQITPSSPQSTPALARLQQAPALDPIAISDSLQLTQPANLGRAPSAPTMPPYLVAKPAGQPAPQSRPLQIRPQVSKTAPTLGQSPEVLAAPAVVAATYSTPVTMSPLRPAQPVALDPFVCVNCDSAIPAFDGARFAVQTSDVNATTTVQLLAALAAYDVDLRTTAILFPSSEVRYYRTEDAEPARALAGRYDANLVDLTWIASRPDIPRIDIILAGSSD